MTILLPKSPPRCGRHQGEARVWLTGSANMPSKARARPISKPTPRARDSKTFWPAKECAESSRRPYQVALESFSPSRNAINFLGRCIRRIHPVSQRIHSPFTFQSSIENCESNSALIEPPRLASYLLSQSSRRYRREDTMSSIAESTYHSRFQDAREQTVRHHR